LRLKVDIVAADITSDGSVPVGGHVK